MGFLNTLKDAAKFTPLGSTYMIGKALSGKGADGMPEYDSSGVGSMDAMKARIDSYKPQTFDYQRKDTSGPLAEFDYNRNKIGEQFNQQGQQDNEAISRRFAAMGMGNSGAAIKATQISGQNVAKARGDALQGLGAEESKARRSLDETENQREFQAGMQNSQSQNQAQQFKLGQFNQLDQHYNQLEQERRQNAYQNEMNKYKANHSGGLLGGGGFLGTGL